MSTTYNSSGIPTGTTSKSTLVRCSSLILILVSSSINSWTICFAASSVSSRFHLRLLDSLALKSATASHVTPIDRLPSGYSLATFCISSPYVGILFESSLSPLQFGHIFVAGSASSSSASLPITILPSPLQVLHFGADASFPDLSMGLFRESWKKDLHNSISSSKGMSFGKD